MVHISKTLTTYKIIKVIVIVYCVWAIHGSRGFNTLYCYRYRYRLLPVSCLLLLLDHRNIDIYRKVPGYRVATATCLCLCQLSFCYCYC
jgi:hypothetical protein